MSKRKQGPKLGEQPERAGRPAVIVTQPHPWGWLPIVAGTVVIAAAVWGVYAHSIDKPFICDDFPTIDTNRSIRTLWPLWGTADARGPLHPPAGIPVSARPLVNLSFALNYHFCGVDPTGYRATNVIIHILTALLLWALIDRTLRLEYFAGRFTRVAGALSFASALLWALHPLNTESVVYVTQRTESLMGLFYIGTLYAALRYQTAAARAPRAAWLALAVVSCLCGALTKEMIASVPAVVLMYERTFVAGTFRRALKQSWPLYLGLSLAWLVLWGINHDGPRTPNAGFDLGIPIYMWWYTEAEVLLLYLKLVIWPHPLVIHYEIPYLETFHTAWPYVAAVGALIAGTLVLVWRRTSAGFVAVTIFAVLSPTLLVPLVGEIVAERRMYVALAAIVPWIVVGCYDVIRNFVARVPAADRVRAARRGVRSFVAAVIALCVIYGIVSTRRLSVFRDQLTLHTDGVQNQPDDILLLVNLGVELARANRPAEAMKIFERVSDLRTESPILNYKLNHDEHLLRFNMGLASMQLGMPHEALKYYDAALALNPDYAPAHNNLGLLLSQYGMPDDAAAHFEDAIRLEPEYPDAHQNLGKLLSRSPGHSEEAIAQLLEAVRLKPEAPVYVDLVDAYVRANRPAEAVAAAQTAIRLARAAGQHESAAQIARWLSAYESPAAVPR